MGDSQIRGGDGADDPPRETMIRRVVVTAGHMEWFTFSNCTEVFDAENVYVQIGNAGTPCNSGVEPNVPIREQRMISLNEHVQCFPDYLYAQAVLTQAGGGPPLWFAEYFFVAPTGSIWFADCGFTISPGPSMLVPYGVALLSNGDALAFQPADMSMTYIGP